MSAEASSAVSSFKRLQAIALPATFVGLILLGVGFQMDVDPGKKIFWSSYLYGFMVWFSLAIGSTTLIFLHHTIRAQWSLSILRIAEACAKTLPLLVIYFLPLVWAAWNGQVYPWANHEIHHHLHPNKQLWYSPIAWTIRSACYFAYWIIGTNYLTKLSLKFVRMWFHNCRFHPAKPFYQSESEKHLKVEYWEYALEHNCDFIIFLSNRIGGVCRCECTTCKENRNIRFIGNL